MSAEIIYDKALKSFLLKKQSVAANKCAQAIAALPKDNDVTTAGLRFNVWMLYLNILSSVAGKPTLYSAKVLGIDTKNAQSSDMCYSVWAKLKESYNTTANIDTRLVSTFSAMAIHLNQLSAAKDIIEEWFTCLPDATLDHISREITQESYDVLTSAYTEIVDLYATRILPGLGEFETAEAFIEYNTVLTDSRLAALKESVKESRDRLEQKRMAKEEQDKAAKLAAIEAEKKAKEAEKKKKELLQEQEKEEEPKIKENHANYTNVSIDIIHEPNHERQVNRLELIKTWINQMAIKGAVPYATILLVALALAGLLNGQKGRLASALQKLFLKFYQTVKMGTTVTYM